MNWKNVFLCWLKSSKLWPSSQPLLPFQPWDSSRGSSSWSDISLPWIELFSRRMSKLSGKAAAFLCLLWTKKGNNMESCYQQNIKRRLFYLGKFKYNLEYNPVFHFMIFCSCFPFLYVSYNLENGFTNLLKLTDYASWSVPLF